MKTGSRGISVTKLISEPPHPATRNIARSILPSPLPAKISSPWLFPLPPPSSPPVPPQPPLPASLPSGIPSSLPSCCLFRPEFFILPLPGARGVPQPVLQPCRLRSLRSGLRSRPIRKEGRKRGWLSQLAGGTQGWLSQLAGMAPGRNWRCGAQLAPGRNWRCMALLAPRRGFLPPPSGSQICSKCSRTSWVDMATNAVPPRMPGPAKPRSSAGSSASRRIAPLAGLRLAQLRMP